MTKISKPNLVAGWHEADNGEHFHPETGEARPTPYLDSKGRVWVSPRPVAISATVKRPETIEETVNRILSHSMQANYYLGEETIDEADDFDIDDDIPDPVTRYEAMHELAAVEAADRGVVRRPSKQELDSAKSVLERAQAFKDSLKPKKATPPPTKSDVDSAPASAGQ